MDLQSLYYVLAVVLVVLGVAGTVLPAIPGIPLIFAGMLLAAWANGFEQVGPWILLVLGVLTVLSVAIDLLATAAGAKRVGASRLALAGAVAGTVVGLFFGLLGLLAGPFVGALAGQLLHDRHLGRATRVGLGTWLGMLVGTVLKIGVVFAMLGIFAAAWFF
ncbi:DUF456 domain-containing protein [Lysobacter sp. H23M47]|uniref:DUF456 domain-containing protein n=1 Tax=Lysobacter sp. H23M47 TaxID=2781024 RepID=UPI0018813DEF|nr:DUF456 domain-containing protein [Lysobacter sp. H23M47]QOW25552.1 DUF456 domain-containing protein [Lysobacter sp. H23M47]